MRDDWFKLFSMNQFESVLRFSQISIRIRIRISFGNWFLYSYVLYVMILLKFSFVPQNFSEFFFFRIRIRVMCRIRISLWNLLEKVIRHMRKISTKFGVAPPSSCVNQNSIQNQDQDQDHDITLDFNTIPTFHTWKTPTKFCLHPLTPSKVIVSTWKVHVRTYIQTSRHPDRQTKIFFGLFCLLRHKNHKHLSKGENFFFTHAITILSLFTYSVCDEKVKKRKRKTDIFYVRESQSYLKNQSMWIFSVVYCSAWWI